MKLRLILFLTLLFNLTMIAQNDSNISVIMLGNDKISNVNIETKKFTSNFIEVLETFKSHFKDIPSSQKVAMLVEYHKERKPTINVHSNPELSEEDLRNFTKKLSLLNYSNTKIIDFPILITINSDDLKSEFPKLELPKTKKENEYINADLKTKYELNKAWAIDEVLPVLAAYQTEVDEKFKGVKNFGTLVTNTDFKNLQDIHKLTSLNSDYWRATMEMEAGNQLIPITKIFMLISQGNFDYALKFKEIVSIFSDPKSISNDYLKELNERLALFNKELEVKISAGIKLHDEGKYDEAILVYNTILKDYPNSAWTLYEKYYSQNEIYAKNDNNRTNIEFWNLSKAGIYAVNPLYNMNVRASNGKEAYLLLRRQEIGTLFKSNKNILKDVNEYANIAFDLEIYDFAAQLFWFSQTFDKNSENALANYLYALEKLNITNLKEVFKINTNKEFKAIDIQKEKEMKESAIYNSFKK